MTERKVIVAGDTEIWTDCPEPHNGGGTGLITNTLDSVLEIEGNAVIVKDQPYTGPDGCPGTAGTNGTCSTVLEVDDVPVVLEGDAGKDDCHGLLGAVSGKQDFVTSD